MKIINLGSDYKVYDDHIKVYDELPAQTYLVRFRKMDGFLLEETQPLTITDPKIYGTHERRVKKVMRGFDSANRSLGVILSGNKGIGKSLLSRMVCIEAVNKGIPVLIVDQYYPDIHDFLDSITQEVVILFDEFDKTFGDRDGMRPQETMLSLFDGISSNKKLFIVTCNYINKLNEHLVNRPGRFHYHFRFDYPTSAEVRTYMEDSLDKRYWSEIPAVVAFAGKVDLNFDCLRAIVRELSYGEPFADIIKELNIVNVQQQEYNINVVFTNGQKDYADGVTLDLFNLDTHYVSLYHTDLYIEFNSKDVIYDRVMDVHTIDVKTVELDVRNVDKEEYKSLKLKSVELVKKGVNKREYRLHAV